MLRQAPLLVSFAVMVASGGCSGGPPPASRADGGTRLPFDGSPDEEDGSVLLGRQDGGPRLPDVEHTIVLPYLGPEHEELFEVVGDIGMLDVFFSIDTTGSFGGEIDNLQSELRSRILPELSARVDNVAVGVGRFEDFPGQPFGTVTDTPFALLTAITDDETRVSNAVAALDRPLGDGADIPEAGAEALYQIATGAGYRSIVPAFGGRIGGVGSLGGVGFREEALRVVVHVTDAPSHTPADYGAAFPGTHSLDDAIDAMNELEIRTLGIASSDVARPHLEAVALGTGAVAPAVGGVCRTGLDGAPRASVGGLCPLVFDLESDGTGLASVVIDAITDFLDTVSYAEAWGEADDPFGFVTAVQATGATPEVAMVDARPAGDGYDDTYVDVAPAAMLGFRAILRNDSIPPADYDQYYTITIRIVGDGVTLTSRRLGIIVPRGRLDAGPRPFDAAISTDGGAADAGPNDDASVPPDA